MTAEDASAFKILSAAEAADALRIGRKRLRDVSPADLPYEKYGRSRYYLRANVVAFAKELKAAPNRRAEHARATFTRYPRWIDAEGRSRALSGHPLFNTWRQMLDRCNPDGGYTPRWDEYGGRGIRVWPPWHDAYRFITDIERKLGPRPAGASLDRIDPDGDYHPDNLQWSTAREQAQNRRPSPGRPDCLCDFDCSQAPGLCPEDAVAWDQVAAALVDEHERRAARHQEPLPTLVGQHLHTGRHVDCWACLKQDPYQVDILGDGPRSPEEWCEAAEGEPYYRPYRGILGL